MEESNGLGAKENRALRPDAQAFDEIHIFTVPRYKTSGLSGDEWRISACVEFYRKGKKVHERQFRNVETACNYLGFAYAEAIDSGHAFFAGIEDICDQEGCHEKATVIYKLKQTFCQPGGHGHEIPEWRQPLVRKFCDRHSKRGDCGLEDSDYNYELLKK